MSSNAGFWSGANFWEMGYLLEFFISFYVSLAISAVFRAEFYLTDAIPLSLMYTVHHSVQTPIEKPAFVG